MKINKVILAFFIMFAVFLSGCSTLMTEKGRHERDLSLEEKELYLARTKDDGYNNCRGAGLSDEVCREKYGLPLDEKPSRQVALTGGLTTRTKNIRQTETALLVIAKNY